jgi:hypothetical protein
MIIQVARYICLFFLPSLIEWHVDFLHLGTPLTLLHTITKTESGAVTFTHTERNAVQMNGTNTHQAYTHSHRRLRKVQVRQ